MSLKTIMLVLAAFIIGFTANQVYATIHAEITPRNDGGYEIPAQLYGSLTGTAIERTSPGDHIAEDAIKVYKDRVVIDVQDAIFATFTDTNSMDPVLDESAHAIEVVPKGEDDVQEGDIVAYKREGYDGTIIHRVVKKGKDQLGAYYIVQGDNNPNADPGKVRFGQIKSVVVGVIY